MAKIKGCAYLPEEVIIEILTRSSVKSLLRFKSVCKSWNALIKSPVFVSKHLNHASSNNDNVRIAIKHCNVVWTRRSIRPVNKAFISFSSNEIAPLSPPRDIPSPFFNDKEGENDMMIYGPCNGVICVVAFMGCYRPYGDEIILWNPATREINHIVVPDLHDRDDSEVYLVTIGFGFDTRSNDYKVIRIIDLEPVSINSDLVVEIYNSSTDSWRVMDVELPAKLNFCSDFSTYLNGFYYWLAADDDNVRFVLSFDFADEVFEKIHLPADIKIPNRAAHVFFKFNETIAILAYEPEGANVNGCYSIWALNMSCGDGERKTWTKLYRIPFKGVHVLGFSSCSEILMLLAGKDESVKLESYDPSTQQFKSLQVHHRSAIDSYLMVDYVESLVSFE